MTSQWCLRAVYQRPQRQVGRKGQIFRIPVGSMGSAWEFGIIERLIGFTTN